MGKHYFRFDESYTQGPMTATDKRAVAVLLYEVLFGYEKTIDVMGLRPDFSFVMLDGTTFENHRRLAAQIRVLGKRTNARKM
jgi:hypothetical protein